MRRVRLGKYLRLARRQFKFLTIAPRPLLAVELHVFVGAIAQCESRNFDNSIPDYASTSASFRRR
jgi:hypothetical protein